MKIAPMLTLENCEFYAVSKRLYELANCLCHHTSLKACGITCFKQQQLSYKDKKPTMLNTMLKTMFTPEFWFHLC